MICAMTHKSLPMALFFLGCVTLHPQPHEGGIYKKKEKKRKKIIYLRADIFDLAPATKDVAFGGRSRAEE